MSASTKKYRIPETETSDGRCREKVGDPVLRSQIRRRT